MYKNRLIREGSVFDWLILIGIILIICGVGWLTWPKHIATEPNSLDDSNIIVPESIIKFAE